MVIKTSFYGNPFLGMYARCNDNIAVIPKHTPEKFVPSLSELDVKLHQMSVFGSSMIGLYISMNSNGIVLPDCIYDEEFLEFKKLGLNCTKISEINNAIGNNIVANDYGGIINPNISKEDQIKAEECLGVELVPMEIKRYFTVGSVSYATNKGFLSHNDLSDADLKEFESIFKVKGLNGTVNMGSLFVGMGMIANSKGMVIGDLSSGVEINRAEDALDLIKG